MKSMKASQKIPLIIFTSVLLLSGCASTTLINSDPQNAKLYLNGEYKGETPYQHSDAKIVGTTTSVKLTKEGYKDYYASFSRTEQPAVGPIIGGFFLLPFWLWVMEYNPERTYILEPLIPAVQEQYISPDANQPQKSKAERLRELKELYDDEILTEEEYEAEKKKILDEDK
jgi:hypothetical protein